MSKFRTLLGVLLILALCLCVSVPFPALADDAVKPVYARGEVIVVYEYKAPRASAKKSGIEVAHEQALIKRLTKRFLENYIGGRAIFKSEPVHKAVVQRLIKFDRTESKDRRILVNNKAMRRKAPKLRAATTTLLKNSLLFRFPKEIDAIEMSKLLNGKKLGPYVIKSATPNYVLVTSSRGPVNDPRMMDQEHLSTIGAQSAWAAVSPVYSPVIAVVDSGVDYNHEDLAQNIWSNNGETLNGIDDDMNGFIDDVRGWDFVSSASVCAPGEDCTIPDNNPMDVAGHGSHVAGLAAAAANAVGGRGVCHHCKIMPVRAGYSMGFMISLNLADVKQAIVYAADNGADIINMSFGAAGDTYSSLFAPEIAAALAAGAIPVAAAGNSNSQIRVFPAAVPGVIAVASLGAIGDNQQFVRSTFTSFGSWVTLSAPGYNLLSTMPNNGYQELSGTSMASPVTAGALGVLLSTGLDGPTAIQKLLSTAKNINVQNPAFVGKLGAGALDLAAAVGATGSPNIMLQTLRRESAAQGIAFPGSTIDLFFTLKNYGFLSGELTATLIESSPSLTVTSALNLQPLTHLATVTNNSSPMRVTIAADAPIGSEPELKLEVSDGNYTVSFPIPLRIAHRAPSNWPVTAQNTTFSTAEVREPLVVDLEGDGKKEIVTVSGFGSNRFLTAYASEGTPIQTMGLPYFVTDPYFAASDMNGDGKIEFAIRSGENRVELVALDSITMSYKRKFQYVGGSTHAYSYPVIGDINGDGVKEVVLVWTDNGRSTRPIVLRYSDGAPLPGFAAPSYNSMNDNPRHSPAVGDITGNLAEEIVYGRDNVVYAYDATGSQVSGFPVTLPNNGFGNRPLIDVSAQIADVDLDGTAEIIQSTRIQTYILKRNTQTGAWAVRWTFGNGGHNGHYPALGDLDNDGDLEIIQYDLFSPLLRVYHHDGTPFGGAGADAWTFPVPEDGNNVWYRSPSVADVNGDGWPDVLAHWSNRIFVFSTLPGNRGIQLPTFPIVFNLPGVKYHARSPVIGDVNNDGRTEILASYYRNNDGADPSQFTIEAFSTMSLLNPAKNFWPMFQGNSERSGSVKIQRTGRAPL